MYTPEKKYMRRALQLAACGAGNVSPNPEVGAVIVAPDGRIIGEGYHRKYGEGHAEVNAVASVKEEDLHLLPQSTIYVTLEPCSHYGKTPPCAKLIIDRGIGRVVTGTSDPNPRVSGRGVRMMRDACIEVIENFMERECREINRRFFTAQILKRPWIMLKYAVSADGLYANPDGTPARISTPATSVLMHRERACCDAIMVGTNTLLSDNPSLTTRLAPGRDPRPVIFDSDRIKDPEIRARLKVFGRDPILLDPRLPLEQNMHTLFRDHGITSLMVEGGATLIRSFLEQGLYDCIREERSSIRLGEE